jgi:hypothetical protein
MCLDPYKAPETDPEASPDMDHPGRSWRIEDGMLQVQDHARLPDVCLLGGLTGASGRRIYLNLRVNGKRVRMVAFCSDEARRARVWRRGLIVAVPALLLGAVAWWALPSGDWLGRFLNASLAVCFAGFVLDRLVGRREFRIGRSSGRWHELLGVDPAAVRELSRFSPVLGNEDKP